MADDQPIAFGPKAVDQIAQTVREVARRMQNETPHRGRWQQRPGGGGGETICFRIVSVECVSSTETILTVEPTWYTGGCTKTIPGADPYTGYVIVEDVCSILRFYTTVFLESGSTIGRATYMYPRAGYCTPTWLVDTICGGPEC